VAAGWLVAVRSRRGVLVGSALSNAVLAALFIAADGHPLAGLVFMTLTGATDSFGWVALSVSIADTAREDELDAAYSAQRVLSAAGLAAGPLLAGGLLLIGWNALWLGACVCALVTAGVGARMLPAEPGHHVGRGARIRPSWRFLRDRVFIGLYVAGAIAYLVFFAYEIVFPIAFTGDDLISPAHLAFIIGLNPALVILLQTRLTHAIGGWSDRAKLIVGPLAMALPASLLLANNAATFLTAALGELGEAEQARHLGQDTLEHPWQVLGPDHMVTLTSTAVLTLVLLDQGEAEQARLLGQDALERCTRVLGRDHPIALRLAQALNSLNQ
jgi:hypothetical protein